MTVLVGFELPLEEELFFEQQGGALQRPALQEAARAGLARAVGLIKPAIAYGWFPVGECRKRTAQVGDVTFELGRHADLLEDAVEALVGVVTVGPRIEAESRELQAAGKALDSYMLDAAGVFSVGLLIQKVHGIVEQEAASRGWGVSAELAPGQLSGWALEEQLLIAKLVDLDAIGVLVTETGMLVPQKSASLMAGIGPAYESAEIRSPCEFCDVQETCRFRH